MEQTTNNKLLVKLETNLKFDTSEVLLQAALVWEEVRAAPAKRNDILAGTEFLSVFINGAMAPAPQRRRGFRDSVSSESQHEASIYRISRNPSGRTGSVARTSQNSSGGRNPDEIVRFYPISRERTFDNGQQNLASLIDDLSMATSFSPKVNNDNNQSSRSNGTVVSNVSNQRGASRQKVIGVSVTSTVEATPYKVRVEHYDSSDAGVVVTRPPTFISTSKKNSERSTSRTTSRSVTERSTSPTSTTTSSTTTTTTVMTPLPARLVTEELTNIVSESNRSEFSVDEGLPRTSWRHRGSITPRTTSKHTSVYGSSDKQRSESSTILGNDNPSGTEVTEENYELSEENSEPHEIHEEPMEIDSEQLQPQGFKSSRQYSEPAKVYSEPAKVYGEPEKVYGEPAKVYGEPSKVYSEPAKVYSEPAKVYGEPAKIYGEPEKVYGEPSKIYSEPSKIYSEPAKIYSQPSKIYGEPSKVYDSEGQPLIRNDHESGGEPDEENYEVDESVSVGTNGKAYGPQLTITEAPNSSDVEDGHKVGYVEEGRNYHKYRVEERTPDGFIVGEYGVVSHDDGSLRGVRYTADGTIDPRLIYDALMKFLAL
ncbi:hypothetical protein HZH66_008588 [Vespula vulgaris]|uniref:Uncharacterized protein n=1 Tax=Vespula vulgaris TaxID=7454 RepID=A0A834JRF9_VESVU|nr:hypothetical protein HZH66_008588 [Vespula vulgaris]